MRKRLLAGLLCLLVLLPLGVFAETDSEIRYEELLECVSGGDLAHWLETELPAGAGRTTDWYAFALAQSGDGIDIHSYAAALAAYLSQTLPNGAVAKQRCALLLLASGESEELASSVAENTIGKQGVMSYVYGLHLLRNGLRDASYTWEDVLAQLLRMQLPDGGWAVSGERADPDVTAMVLQAIAPYRAQCSFAVQEGVRCLSELQLPSGGFASYGTENAESVCQVLIALTALEIEPTDARFQKQGKTLLDALSLFRLENGGYCHTVGSGFDQTATVQALLAMTAIRRRERGLGDLYALDRVPTSAGHVSDSPVSDVPSVSGYASDAPGSSAYVSDAVSSSVHSSDAPTFSAHDSGVSSASAWQSADRSPDANTESGEQSIAWILVLCGICVCLGICLGICLPLLARTFGKRKK